jgi:hypothetical protein
MLWSTLYRICRSSFNFFSILIASDDGVGMNFKLFVVITLMIGAEMSL